MIKERCWFCKRTHKETEEEFNLKLKKKVFIGINSKEYFICCGCNWFIYQTLIIDNLEALKEILESEYEILSKSKK